MHRETNLIKNFVFSCQIHYFCPPKIKKAVELFIRVCKSGRLLSKPKCVLIMYAIVDIAGQQFKVEAGKKIYVHRLADEVGSTVTFDKVLLTDNDGAVTVGTPYVEGAAVKAKVLEHLKGNKVIVFKKIAHKGFDKKNGHRQYLTRLEIESIA